MPGRRPLLAFVALFTLPLSACLHIGTSAVPTPRDEATKVVVKPIDPPSPPKTSQTDFNTLPRAPGTVMPINKQPNGLALNGTTGQKSNAPPAPPGPTQAGGMEPKPFPPIMQTSVPTEAPLLRAMREYTEGHPERAIEIIRTLDKPNQDFVLAVLPILARGASADLNNDPATIGMLVDQLDAVRSRLEQRAALRAENITFCKEVSGFGRYMPRPANEPYRPNTRVDFYLEVKNLGSRPSGSEFITHIFATVEIRDAHGKLVEQIAADDYKRRVPVVQFDKRLVSHSPLRDFHVLYMFSAPPAPGVYTITLELRDAATGRTVKTPPAQFCVAGP